MHLLVRETRSLDDDAPPVDLGQSPADLLFLSFSDSDLGAVAAAWQAMGAPRPSLRLASLAQLRHPMSVDRYLEQTAAGARCVLVRLLGGLDYWRYGAEELSALCGRAGIPLALLPSDAREDARLAALSTVDPVMRTRLDALLREGGPVNVGRALDLAAHLAGHGPDPALPPVPLAPFGTHDFAVPSEGPAGRAALVFYRSHLLAADLAPLEALAAALAAQGLGVRGLHVGSLKDGATAAFVAGRLQAWRPEVVLNATGFSARRDGASPLDPPGAPVLQLLLAGAPRDAWAASARGLSPADLAMQVVLPELDGRLATTAIGFKAAQAPVPGLEFARTAYAPDAEGVALAADRAAGWARLAATPRAARRLAIVLSDYPGAGGQAAHAVGLDTFASLAAILRLLEDAGYATAGTLPDAAALARMLAEAAPVPFLDAAGYRALFATLPESLRARVLAVWGAPEGGFALRHLRVGRVLLAIQPDRGHRLDRRAAYHDPDTPPGHAYIAFYLWLRAIERVDALVHLGTHGTLEWLPGKAAAPAPDCAGPALLRGLPVVYPFIVNNPGEAAAAKRRLGAVTIGHLTPPLAPAGLSGEAAALERLIDEYAAADGLDRRRTALLRGDILARAEAAGLLAESGARDLPDDDALARLDAYLCDVKDMQVRQGLHVFATRPSPAARAALLAACPALNPARLDACAGAEAAALLTALDGRFVPPGPAGAPSRGRTDVLPTGRNLFAVDPRTVPTRAALLLAERAAEQLLRRHVQEHGEWPRRLVLDLWGSATMRTGGEDFALALVLMGARPTWDEGSSRVTGIEILPLALLDRPRVDVTLRISGLFRDAFEAQIALFDSAVRAIAARDEAAEDNPLAAAACGLDGAALRAATARVFGAAPGDYGAGVEALLARGAWHAPAELGAAYLAASAHAYGHGLDGAAAADAFAARVRGADAFLHVQDHRETDLLDGADYAAHEGGFAAAAAALGGAPALYHADTATPEAPRLRTLAEEIARVVRGRAANPRWIAGMMAHGYRGAAEIARGVDNLHAFAATLPTRLDAQFDLLFAATLAEPAVDGFLRDANRDAHAAMRARFAEARARGLWRSRRNDVAEILG
ncbi:MAG: cobaltochelatase subunit CobN [Alphaproteobacteria bacterium]|nr:cobaltochelatase subunit CobN [Alphaproteobacteria bacterium]